MGEYEDYPVRELIAGANEAVMKAAQEGIEAHVYFKATCPKCGERCVFSVADTVFEQMECSACGWEFPFVEGNYMLVYGGELP